MKNYELSLSVFTSNIKSIISIYTDSEEVRKRKEREFEDKLKEATWTKDEFEEFSHYHFHFNWLLIQALFISGFSYFESFMKSTAKNVEKVKGQRIKLKDLKGEGYLDTYRKYIHLVGEIEFANSTNKEWKDISDFRKIRNSIAHEYGEVRKTVDKINEHDIYFGPGKRHIRIKNVEFLEDFVETSTNYMNLLISELKEKINGSNK